MKSFVSDNEITAINISVSYTNIEYNMEPPGVANMNSFLTNTTMTITDKVLNNTISSLKNTSTMLMTFDLPNSKSSLDSQTVSVLTCTLLGLILFIMVLGLCGNLVTLVIMWQSRQTQKSHDILITALAISDCITLVPTTLSHSSVSKVVGVDIRAITYVGCKLYAAIWQSATTSTLSVVVLISVERFLAVWFPLRAAVWLSPKRIMGSVLGSVAFNVVFMFTMNILLCDVKDGICGPFLGVNERGTFLKAVGNLYATTLAILPTSTILLIILTTLTILKLYRQMSRMRQLTQQQQQGGVQFKTFVKLVAVVVEHILFVGLPGAVGLIVGMSGAEPPSPHDAGAGLDMMVYALLVNHSTNFILYSVFDSVFRKKVVNLFTCAQGTISRAGTDSQSRNQTTAI